MSQQTLAEGNGPGRTNELDHLEAHLEIRLCGRVRQFHLMVLANGLILQGRAPTYYVKQLAQNAVMEATELPILGNEIEVTGNVAVFPGRSE